MGISKTIVLHVASWSLFFGGASWRANAQQILEPTVLVAELPDSPGAAILKSQSSTAPQASSQPLSTKPVSTLSLAMQDQATTSQQEQVQSSQSNPPSSGTQVAQVSQPPGQTPVGTAAAGVVPATGIAASQPSGVAIAPAKQHRVRTIVIRTGAILAAAAAVGSVVALTEGTSSRPPGAR
jgi:hypothetical protein